MNVHGKRRRRAARLHGRGVFEDVIIGATLNVAQVH
jgi:hypothetical protein